MESLLQIVTAAVVTAVGVVTTALLKEGFRYLRGKVKSEEAREALSRIEREALNVVGDLEGSARKYMSDGKLSQDEAKMLRDQAITRIQGRLPKDVSQAAEKALNGAVKDYIGGAVENALVSIKGCKAGG